MRKSKLRNNVGIFLEKSTSKDPIRNYRTVKWYSGRDEKTGVELYTTRKSDYTTVNEFLRFFLCLLL